MRALREKYFGEFCRIFWQWRLGGLISEPAGKEHAEKKRKVSRFLSEEIYEINQQRMRCDEKNHAICRAMTDAGDSIEKKDLQIKPGENM